MVKLEAARVGLPQEQHEEQIQSTVFTRGIPLFNYSLFVFLKLVSFSLCENGLVADNVICVVVFLKKIRNGQSCCTRLHKIKGNKKISTFVPLPGAQTLSKGFFQDSLP